MSEEFEVAVKNAKAAELGVLDEQKMTDDIQVIAWELRFNLNEINDYVDHGWGTPSLAEGLAENIANLGTELAVALTGNDDLVAIKQYEHDVLISKHRDYGPRNIADSPGGALNGLRVRLHDKLARLYHLIESGADPEHESLADTALDIANYGTIMGMVLRGEWPGA